MPEDMSQVFSEEDLRTLRSALALDPRPHYHDDDNREYGMPFLNWDIRFKVANGVLKVEKWIKK
jgi:hypothetical protein